MQCQIYFLNISTANNDLNATSLRKNLNYFKVVIDDNNKRTFLKHKFENVHL